MKGLGLSLNDVTYSILIDSFSKSGKLDVALFFLDKMVEEGVRPSVYPSNSLIDGCSKLRKLSISEKLFDEMTKVGLTPTVVTYTSLISGYCREEDMNRTYCLYHSMYHQGISPNTHKENHRLSEMSFFALVHGVLQGRAGNKSSRYLHGNSGKRN
ncbi:Pentatricopeptide repeat-containing protein [Thalictrum thalictroides]|uniref:Pentatricopeptide repeat-containing protein n=1 Tax=Thalictrum thalictroides TaxID=46969 RepID=A0A7J6WIH4_THATH|nr:Pentatricopeptide repeat-containing protein [Thalictrum thalictroides]